MLPYTTMCDKPKIGHYGERAGNHCPPSRYVGYGHVRDDAVWTVNPGKQIGISYTIWAQVFVGWPVP